MGEAFPIHDLIIRPLPSAKVAQGTAIVVLAEDDHLLRRFGHLEILHLERSTPQELAIREVADEAWALLEGRVDFLWQDLRTVSPSHGVRFRQRASEPTLVLVPFGVAFGVQVLSAEAKLVRISTHKPGQHAGDHTLPLEVEAWD